MRESSTSGRRRLAAIMMLDVAGFSAMMSRDDEATTDRILAFHAAVRLLVEDYGGVVAGTAGDSVLGRFDSVVDAVACAARLQEELAAAANDDGEDAIRARIGMHLGDVIVDGDTVFGDGVNIAARLEEMAEPGGILVSEAVWQQVTSRVDLPFEEVGARSLKNISQPVRLYRVAPEAFGPVTPPGPADGDAPSGEQVVTDSVDAIREAVRDAARMVSAARREGPARSTPAERAEWHRARMQRARDRAERHRGGGGRRSRVAAALSFGNLSLLALGIVLIAASTPGFTGGGWPPFLGSVLIGLSLGQMIAGATAWPPARPLGVAVGFAVGGLGFGHVAARAVTWVVAAGLVGRAFQRVVGD
jgi:class 3 adenylate cyclase